MTPITTEIIHPSPVQGVAEALRSSEIRYRRVFEAARDGILILDAVTGKITDVNPFMMELLGYSHDEFLGKELWEIGLLQDAATSAAAFSDLQKTGYLRYEDLPLQTKSGERRDVEVVSNLYDEAGHQVVQCNIRDITERLQAEAQRDRFFTMAVDILGTFGLDGKFKRMNPAFTETLGFTEDEIIDKPFMEWVHPEDQAATLAAVGTLAQGKPVLNFENRYRTKSGFYRWLEWKAVSILEEGLMYAAARDVTERKQAEQTQQIAHDELESRVRERTTELETASEQLHMELTERKRTEAALREAQQMLQLVMNHIPQAIFWKNRESLFLGCNYRFASDTGLDSPAEVIGKSDFDMPSVEYAEAYRADDRQVMEMDTAKLNIEESFLKADGSRAWLRTNKIPLHDSEDQVVGVLCSYEDITEQKHFEATILEAKRESEIANEGLQTEIVERQRAEADVQRSQEELQSLIDAMSTLAAKVAPDGTFLIVNKIAIDASGLTREKYMTTNFLEGPWWAFDSEVQTRVRNVFGQALSGTPINYDENIFVFGQERTINFSLIPISDEEGKVEYLVAEGRDITERRQAETLLQESQQRLALATESAHIGIWDWDVVANKMVWDEQMYFLYGIGEQDFTGAYDAWQNGLHPEDLDQAEADTVLALNGTKDFHCQFRVVWPNGELRHIEAHALVQRADDGSALRMIGVNWDITELKHTESAILRAKEEAERANQAKSEFLSRMSHELRTPLNAILGFGQLLAKQNLAPTQQERVQLILKAGRHLLDLINEVLDIAQIESGHLLLSLEPVQVRETIEEVFSLVKPLADEHGIHLQCRDDSNLDLFVWADRQRLKQVLLNLCFNAIKYNRPQGTVAVSCQIAPIIPSQPSAVVLSGVMTGDQLRLNVTDTGLGIASASQAQLFAPFMRVGAEHTAIEGTGLGLALSLNLMHAMGGTIGMESTVGVGSTFWVQLPLASAPTHKEPEGVIPPDVAPGPESTARFTLLYIEDNLSNLQLVQEIVAEEPTYKLIPALQGQIGLDLARQHHPDLIILDLHLPDMPGDQVLARLKANPATASIPVVMLSAVAVDSEIKRLLASGASAYLTKPLDIDLFLDTLADIL